MAKTILIADDEPESLEFLRHFFEEKNFEVFTAINGVAAVETAQQINPDVILLDIRMPQMDGLQALKKIKNANPAAKVIMLTAVEDQQKMEDAIRLGAENYILKPFVLEYLEKRVLDLVID